MEGSQEELNLEFNIIDNIIGSAVDDGLMKDSSVHYDYKTLLPLLQPLCRFCVRENGQMMHISDVHQQIINDLRIPEIHGRSVCTNICGNCNGFLEEFCKFRSVCEEGQKRLATLLAGRHVLPHYLKLDSTVPNQEPLSVDTSALCDHKSLSSIETGKSSPEYVVSETTIVTGTGDGMSPITLHLSVVKLQDVHPQSEVQQRTAQELVHHSSNSPDRGYGTHVPEESNNIQIAEEITCDETFSNNAKDIINAHTFKTVIDEKPKNKPVAQKRTQKPEARRRVVEGRLEWICLDCEQIFSSCLQLKKHRRSCEFVGSKTSKRLATLGCDICGETMSTESALTMHRRKHEAKVKRPTASKKFPSLGLEPIVCHVCGHTKQTDSNSWDDLIEYQPEDILSATTDDTTSEATVLVMAGESTNDTCPPEMLSPYASDELYNICSIAAE
uniref:C2H2-type domain-containing protein n=1 Tax=Anopheles epiroticus TaxID=199890 RepID=A0A182PNI6_9DIPT